MTLAGLSSGLLLAFWLARSLRGLLFQTRTDDPTVFVLTTTLMLAAAIAATITPALHAARARPVEVLRAM